MLLPWGRALPPMYPSPAAAMDMLADMFQVVVTVAAMWLPLVVTAAAMTVAMVQVAVMWCMAA